MKACTPERAHPFKRQQTSLASGTCESAASRTVLTVNTGRKCEPKKERLDCTNTPAQGQDHEGATHSAG